MKSYSEDLLEKRFFEVCSDVYKLITLFPSEYVFPSYFSKSFNFSNCIELEIFFQCAETYGVYANPRYYEEWIRDVTSIPADPPTPPVTPFDPCPCSEYIVDSNVLSLDGDGFVNENGDVTLEKGDDENQWTYSAPGISEAYEVETYYDQEC